VHGPIGRAWTCHLHHSPKYSLSRADTTGTRMKCTASALKIVAVTSEGAMILSRHSVANAILVMTRAG